MKESTADLQNREREKQPEPIKVYHYTTQDAYKTMQVGDPSLLLKDPRGRGYIDGAEARGIYPMERFVPLHLSMGLEYESGNPCIFALLEPKDPHWFNSRASEALKRYTSHGANPDSLILIEIELTPEQLDKTFVVEGAYKAYDIDERFSAFKTDTEVEMYRKSWRSRIPIKEYLDEDYDFALPEVIIQDRIDLEFANLIEIE